MPDLAKLDTSFSTGAPKSPRCSLITNQHLFSTFAYFSSCITRALLKYRKWIAILTAPRIGAKNTNTTHRSAWIIFKRPIHSRTATQGNGLLQHQPKTAAAAINFSISSGYLCCSRTFIWHPFSTRTLSHHPLAVSVVMLGLHGMLINQMMSPWWNLSHLC